MTRISPSALRADIYRILDEILETGRPLEVTRKGRTLRIVPDEPSSRLDDLVPRPGIIVGDPEELVDLQVWEWAGDVDPDAPKD